MVGGRRLGSPVNKQLVCAYSNLISFSQLDAISNLANHKGCLIESVGFSVNLVLNLLTTPIRKVSEPRIFLLPLLLEFHRTSVLRTFIVANNLPRCDSQTFNPSVLVFASEVPSLFVFLGNTHIRRHSLWVYSHSVSSTTVPNRVVKVKGPTSYLK